MERIFFILLLIFLNATFVLAEYSLIALRKFELKNYFKKRAFASQLIKTSYDKTLFMISTAGIGSTICNILTGFNAEPIVNKLVSPYLQNLSNNFIPTTSISLNTIFSIGIISFLQITFGELIPKAIALQKNRIILNLSIFSLMFFSFVLYPFVFIVNQTSIFFLKLIRIPSSLSKTTDYAREEIKFILDDFKKKGVIAPKQNVLIKKILSLQNMPLIKLMTPKEKLIYFKIDDTLKKIRETIIKNKYRFNRYPIFNLSQKKMLGFIHLSDMLRFADKNNDNTKIYRTNFIRKILYFSKNKKIDELLFEMRKNDIFISAVIDKDKETLGIITLTDIIEYLVKIKTS